MLGEFSDSFDIFLTLPTPTRHPSSCKSGADRGVRVPPMFLFLLESMRGVTEFDFRVTIIVAVNKVAPHCSNHRFSWVPFLRPLRFGL